MSTENESGDLESEVEIIYKRMFRRRLSPNLDELKNWKGVAVRNLPKGKSKEYIQDLIQKDLIVTSGYLATAIRGHHDYWIFHKERKSK